MDTSKARTYAARAEVNTAFHVDNIRGWRSTERKLATAEQEAAWQKVNQHESGLSFRGDRNEIDPQDVARARTLRDQLGIIVGTTREGDVCATLASVFLRAGEKTEAHDMAVRAIKTADKATAAHIIENGMAWNGSILVGFEVLLALGYEPLHEIGAAA